MMYYDFFSIETLEIDINLQRFNGNLKDSLYYLLE